jgi:hypothetical protein
MKSIARATLSAIEDRFHDASAPRSASGRLTHPTGGDDDALDLRGIESRRASSDRGRASFEGPWFG